MKVKIEIPIYFGELVITQSKSLKKIGKKFEFENITHNAACAFPVYKKNGYAKYYMCFTKELTPEIIAHEALHVTNMIMYDRGLELDPNNDEAQAYLLGWVVQQCHNHLKYIK